MAQRRGSSGHPNGKNTTSPAGPGRTPRTHGFLHVAPLWSTTRREGVFEFVHERFRGLATDTHVHTEWQVIVPLAGRSHVQAGGEGFLLGPEGGLAIPPGLPHANHLLDGEYEYMSVLAPAGWLAADEAPPGRALPFAEPFLWALARHLASELDRPGPGADELLRAGAAQLRVYLARALAGAAPARPAADPRVLRAIDRIVREHAEDLTITTLAADAHMTARHFERCFKQATGMSPRRYLIDVRLAAARTLLTATDLAVADVAAECGFYDASHFIAAFRRATGGTPAAWRKAAEAGRDGHGQGLD